MLWLVRFSWVGTGWYLLPLMMELCGTGVLALWPLVMMTKGCDDFSVLLARLPAEFRRLQKHMTKARVKRAKEARPEATNTLIRRLRDVGGCCATWTSSAWVGSGL